MPELTYEELRRIQAREREPALSKLPDDFYSQIDALLSKYKNIKSLNGQREYENILKILRYIFSRREEKILNASINSLKGIEPSSGMIQEELETYRKFVEILKSDKEIFEKRICSVSSGPDPTSSIEKIVEVEIKEPRRESETDQFSVRIIKDIDEFIGLDGKVYGPYKNNSEVKLPTKEAETLLKMRMVEKIEAQVV